MLNKVKNNLFTILLLLTIIYCVLSLIYCWTHGQEMASSHIEYEYSWRFLQIVISIIIGIIFSVLHKDILWLYIPSLLILTALLYIPIVAQYPCCSGG